MPPSVVYKFPSGKVVRQVPMSFGSRVVPVTRGDYLLLGPAQKHPLEISSLTVGKRTLLLDQPAADVYNRIYAHQLLGGDLGIYSLDTGTLQSRAAFPPGGSDAYFRAMASPDLKWVATPAGAIWNLANGKMVQHLRTFYGGSFDGDKAFYGDFPGHRGTHRALIRIDLVNGNITGVREITDAKANLSGLYFVVTEPHQTKPTQGLFSPCRWKFPDFEPMDCDVTYEISDALNGRTLWSRAFEKEAPDFQVEPEQGRMVVSWAASDAAVGDEINKLPQLKNKWDTVRKQPGEDFVEILHLSNGSVRHAMFVNGGIEGSFLTAGQHLLAVHSGYIEIYSLATGAKEGEIPGGPGAVSSSGSLLASSGDAANKLNIYDLQSRDRLDRFTFPDDVDFEQFSSTGNRLLVLTQDQTAYILDVPAVKEHISNR